MQPNMTSPHLDRPDLNDKDDVLITDQAAQGYASVDHTAIIDSYDDTRRRALYRKVDLHLLPVLILLYLQR